MSTKMIASFIALAVAAPVLSVSLPADAASFSKSRSGGSAQARTSSKPTVARQQAFRAKRDAAKAGTTKIASAKMKSLDILKPKEVLDALDPNKKAKDAFEAAKKKAQADQAKVDAAKVDPAKTDAPKGGGGGKTDPAKTDPAKTDPPKGGGGGKTDPAKTDPGKGGGGGKADGGQGGGGKGQGGRPKGPFGGAVIVFGSGHHHGRVVFDAPAPSYPRQPAVAKRPVTTDPVCVQGTWATQDEKKVYVCLSWYFRGHVYTPDELQQVLTKLQ